MFPTPVRNTALGTCSMAGRLGALAAPYIAGLGGATGRPFLPFLVFGVSTLLGGTTALLLPETCGTALPATVQDAERLAREQPSRGCCSTSHQQHASATE